MQAIKESNEHLEKAIQAKIDAGDTIDKKTEMYFEPEMARTLAYQAIAYALLVVADALKESE